MHVPLTITLPLTFTRVRPTTQRTTGQAQDDTGAQPDGPIRRDPQAAQNWSAGAMRSVGRVPRVRARLTRHVDDDGCGVVALLLCTGREVQVQPLAGLGGVGQSGAGRGKVG